MSAAPAIADVWCAAGLGPSAPERALRLLSPGERSRADRIAYAPARATFILVRALLRRILGDVLGTAPGSLVFEYGPTGKPSLAGDPVHFSVAHAAGCALVAVGAFPLGVDLEPIRPRRRIERVLARLFPTETTARLAGLPEAERAAAFCTAWTQREAYVKAVGGGIFATPVALPYVDPATTPHVLRAPGDDRPWSMISVPVPSGFTASLAAPVASLALRMHDAEGAST